MKTIATPVAESLAQLHDHAAGVVKLIEAIPVLGTDDLQHIVNRALMLRQLKELQAAEKYLRVRVQLRKAHKQAKQLATRVEVLRKVATDVEVDEAIAELQGERRPSP